MKFKLPFARRKPVQPAVDARFSTPTKTGLQRMVINSARTATVLDLDDSDGADFEIISSPVPDVLRPDLKAVIQRLNGYGYYQDSRSGDGNVIFTPPVGSAVGAIGVWARWGFPTTAGLPGQLAVRTQGVDDSGGTVDFTAIIKPNAYSGGCLIIPARIVAETGITVVTPLALDNASPVTVTLTSGVATATYSLAVVCRGSTQFGSLVSSLKD